MAALLIVLVAVLGAMFSADASSFILSSCDATCSPGSCTNQSYPQDQCLQATQGSVQARCGKGPAVCLQNEVYSDAACSQLVKKETAVCNSCQGGNSYICGALEGIIIWQYGCGPNCNNCKGVHKVPENTCHEVATGKYVIIRHVVQCGTVHWDTYQGSQCAGNATKSIYGTGYCNEGAIFYC
jgi:hypothetical protein